MNSLLLVDYGFWNIKTKFASTPDAVEYLLRRPEMREEFARRRAHCLERSRDLRSVDIDACIWMATQAQFCREAIEALDNIQSLNQKETAS